MKKNKKKLFFILGGAFLGLSLVTAIGLHSFNQGVVNNTFSSDLNTFLEENERNLKTLKTLYNNKDDLPYNRKDEFKENENAFFNGERNRSNSSSSPNSSNSSNDTNYYPFSINNQKERYKDSHFQYSFNYNSQLTNTFRISFLKDFRVINDLVKTRIIKISNNLNNETKTKLEVLDTLVFKTRLLSELKNLVDSQEQFATIYDDAKKLYTLLNNDENNIFVTELKLHFLRMKTEFEKQILIPFNNLKTRLNNKLNTLPTQSSENKNNLIKFVESFNENYDLILDHIANNIQILTQSKNNDPSSKNGYNEIFNDLNTFQKLPLYSKLNNNPFLTYNDRSLIPQWFKELTWSNKYDFNVDLSNYLSSPFIFKSPFLVIDNIKFIYSENNTRDLVDPTNTGDNNIHTRNFQELSTLLNSKTTLIGKYNKVTNKFIFKHPNDVNKTLFEVQIDQSSLDSLTQSGSYNIQDYELTKPSKVKIYFYRDKNNVDLLDSKKTSGLIKIQDANDEYEGITKDSYTNNPTDINKIISNNIDNVYFKNQSINDTDAFIDSIKDDYALIWVNNWQKLGAKHQYPWIVDKTTYERITSRRGWKLLQSFSHDWINYNNPLSKYFIPLDNDNSDNSNIDYFLPEHSLLTNDYNQTYFDSIDSLNWNSIWNKWEEYYPLNQPNFGHNAGSRNYHPMFDLHSSRGGILHDFLDNGFILVKKSTLRYNSKKPNSLVNVKKDRLYFESPNTYVHWKDLLTEHIGSKTVTAFNQSPKFEKYRIDNNNKFNIGFNLKQNYLGESYNADHNVWWFLKHRNDYLQNREQNVDGFYPLYSLPKKPKKDIESEFPTDSKDSNLNMENHRNQIKDIQKQRNLANQEYLEMFEEIVLKNKDEWISSITTSIYKDREHNKNYVLPVRKYKTYLDNIPTSIWNSLLKTSQGQKFKESLLNQFKSSTTSTFRQSNVRFVENEKSATKPTLLDNYNNSISHNNSQTVSNSIKKIKYENYETSHLLVNSSYFYNENRFVNKLVSLEHFKNNYSIYDYNNLPFESNTKVVILPIIRNPQTFKGNEENIPQTQKEKIFTDGNAITINNQEWVIVPILYRKQDVLPIEVINENKKIKDIINRSTSDNFLTNIPKNNLYEIENNTTRLYWTDKNPISENTFEMTEKIRSFLSRFLRLLILRYTDNYIYYYNMSESDRRKGNAVVNNNSYYDGGLGRELNEYRTSESSIFKDVYSFMVIGNDLYDKNYYDNPHVLRQITALDNLVLLGFNILSVNLNQNSNDRLKKIDNDIKNFNKKLNEIFNDKKINHVYTLQIERPYWNGFNRGAKEFFKWTDLTLSSLLGEGTVKRGFNSSLGSLEPVLKITNGNLIPVLTRIFNKLDIGRNLISNKIELTSNIFLHQNDFSNLRNLIRYFQNTFDNNQNKGYALLQVLFQIAWSPGNYGGNTEYLDVSRFFGFSDGENRRWELQDQIYDLSKHLNFITKGNTYRNNSTNTWNWMFKENTFTSNLVWRPKDSYINNDDSFGFYHSNKNEYFVKQTSNDFFSIISSRKNQTTNHSFKKINLIPYYKGGQYYDYSFNKINILNVDKDNTTIVTNGYANNRFYHLKHGLFYDYINNQQDSSLPFVVPKIFVESYSKVLSWLRNDMMTSFIYERPSNVDSDLSTTEKNRMKEILKRAFSNMMQRPNYDTYRTFENLKTDISNAINQSRSLNHPIKLLYYLESGMFFKDFSHNKYINQNVLNHWLINGSEIDIEDLKKENWISFKNQNLFTHNLNPNQWFITEDGLYRLEIQRNPLKNLRSIPWSNFVNYSSGNQKNTPKVDIYTQNLDNVVLKDNNLREFIKELNNVVGDKSNITHLNVIDRVKRFVKDNSKIIKNKEFDTKSYDIDAFLFNIIKDYFETQLKLHRLVEENIPVNEGDFKRWKFEKVQGVDGLWKESSDSQTILDSFYTPTFHKSTSDVSKLLEKNAIVNAYNIINKQYPNKVVRLVLDTFVFNKTTFKTFVNENGTLNSVDGSEVLLSKDDKELHKAFHVFNTYHKYLIERDKTNINAWMFLFKYIVGLDQISELDNYVLPFYLIEQNNRIGIDLNNFFFYSNEINNNIKNFENIINYGDIRYKNLLNNKRLEWMFDLITKQYPKQYLDHTKKYQLTEIIKKIKSYDVFENFNNEDSKVKLIRNEYKYQFGNKSAKMITISDYGIGMSTQTTILNKTFETKNQSNQIVHFKPYEQFDYETIINNHIINNPITSNQIVFLVNEEINTNYWISLYPSSTSISTTNSNTTEDLPNPLTRLYKSTKTFVVIDLDKVVNFDEYALAFVYQHPTYGELLFTIRFNLETRKHEIIIGDYYKNQLNNEIVNDIVHLDKFVGKFNNYTTSNDPVSLNNYELKLETHFLKDSVNNIYKNSVLPTEFNDSNQQMNYVNMEFVLQPNTSNTNLFENYNIWFNNPNNVPNDYFNRYNLKHLSNKQSLNMTESIWYTFSDKKDIIFKPQFDIDTIDYFTHAENQEKNYSVTNNIPLYYYINNRIINLLNLLFDYERIRTYNRVVFKDFVHSYDRRKIKVELDEYLKLLQNTNDPFALIINKNVKMTIQMLEGVNAITKTENNQTKWLKDINDSDSSMMLNLNSTKSISEVIKTGIVYIYHNSLKINELSKKYRQYTTLEKLTNEQLQNEITRLNEEIKQINKIPNHTPKEIGLLETFLYKIKSPPLNRLIDESHLIVNESNPSNIQLSQTHQTNKELNKIVSSLTTFLQSNKSQSLFFTQEYYDQVSKLLEYYLTLIYQMITNHSYDNVVVNNDKFDILIKNLYDGAIGIKHYEHELNPDRHSEYSYGSFLLTPTHTLEWYNSKIANHKHANNSNVFPKNDANQDFVYKKDITLQYNESTNRIFDINYSRNSTSTPYDKNNPNLRFNNNNRLWNDVKNNNKSNFVYNNTIVRPKPPHVIVPFWEDYKNTVLAFLDILENDFYFLDDFLKNPRKFVFNDEFVSGFNLLMLWIMPIIGTNTSNFTTNNFNSKDWEIMNTVKSQLKKFVDSYNYSKQKISNNIDSISRETNYNSEPNKKKLNNSMVTNEGLLLFDKNNTQGNIFIFNNNDGFSLFKQDSSSNNVDDSIKLIKSFANQNYIGSKNPNHFNLYFEITKRIIKTIKNKLQTTTRNGSVDEGNTMTTLVSTLQQIMFVYRNVERIDPWFNQNLDVNHTKETIKEFIENENYKEMNEFLVSMLGWTSYINQSMFKSPIWKPTTFFVGLFSPATAIVRLGMTIADTINKYNNNVELLNQTKNNLKKIVEKIELLNKMINFENAPYNLQTHLTRFVSKLFNVEYFKKKIENLTKATHWKTVTESFFVDLFAGWYYSIWRNPSFEDQLNFNLNRYHHSQLANMFEYLKTIGIYDHNLVINPNDITLDEVVNAFKELFKKATSSYSDNYYKFKVHEKIFVFKHGSTIITYKMPFDEFYNWTLQNETPVNKPKTNVYYTISPKDLANFPSIKKPTYTNETTDYSAQDRVKVEIIKNKYNTTYEQLFKTLSIWGLLKINKSSGN